MMRKLLLSRQGLSSKPICQLALVALAITTGAYMGATVSPLQETIRNSLHLTDNQMALLGGFALSVPAMLTSIPVGLAIDRYSRVKILYVVTLLTTICNAWIALATSFSALLLNRIVMGPLSHSSTQTAVSLVGDLYPPAKRGRASTLLVIGQVAGMSAAFAVGGTLLGRFGTSANAWRWAVLGITTLAIPVLIVLLLMREPTRHGVALRQPTPMQSFIELWHYRARVVPLMAGLVMGEIAINSVMIWAAPALTRHLRLTPFHVGTIMSAAVLVGGAVGSIFGGWLADFSQRVGGARRTMLVVAALSVLSVPASAFGVVPRVGMATVMLAVLIISRSAIIVISLALFTIVIPNELRGLSLAISGAANVIFGSGLAPIAVSALSGLMGGGSMIGMALAAVCGSASLLCAIIFIFGIPYVPRDA